MELRAALIFPTAIILCVNNCALVDALDCAYGNKTVAKGTAYGNGTLVTIDGDQYPRDTWETDGDEFYACNCIARPCFPKCCPENQELYALGDMCENVPDDMKNSFSFRPTVYKMAGLHPFIYGNETEKFNKRFDTVIGFPCDDFIVPDVGESSYYYLFDDGTLAAYAGETFHDPPEFCYLTIMSESDLVPAICIKPEGGVPLRYYLYCAGMMVSIPCFFVTFVVYACLKRLYNIHGRCLMSHVLALLMGYIPLCITGLSPGLDDVTCIVLAFIIYYAFLASFFWLNVMCLDIWWTFSGFRPMRGSVKEREHKKFVIYSLYCWGSPLIMLMIALIMDLHPGIPETYEKPGFGEKKCWFRSTISNLIYFSGPIAILIVCNIVLFILTAFKIRQIKRGTKILKKQDSRRHNEEEENNAQRFKLYLKLFSVMGVNWIMEVISFAAGGPDEWWYVTDIMNTLQGLLIFFIFVCKRRIFRLLKERFYPESAGTTNSINTSSTRMTAIRRNGSVMSSTRGSLKTQEGYPMKGMAASARSDDSDVA